MAQKGCGCSAPYNVPKMGSIPSPTLIKTDTAGASVSGSQPAVRQSSTYNGGPPPDIPKSDCPPPAAPLPCVPPPTEETNEKEEVDEEKLKKWVSPLRKFDIFASNELRRREIAEEDFPRLRVPQLKGQHKCKVSCLLNHSVEYAVDMEKELRNIGIQETHMLDMLEKLTKAEAAVRFQGAVRAAEVAAMSAPPDLAEEAAVAGARGYTVETQEFSKKSSPGENPIEIIGYIGCTRPNNF